MARTAVCQWRRYGSGSSCRYRKDPLKFSFFIHPLINVVFHILSKDIPFEFRLGPVNRRRRSDIKRGSLFLQHTGRQRKIISGICCGCLDRENIPMNLFQMISGVARNYGHRSVLLSRPGSHDDLSLESDGSDNTAPPASPAVSYPLHPD